MGDTRVEPASRTEPLDSGLPVTFTPEANLTDEGEEEKRKTKTGI